MTHKICAIIATYNHHLALQKTIDAIKKEGLEIYIIDDGSTEETQAEIKKIVSRNKGVFSSRLKKNAGKGAAVKAGLRLAKENGFTHAFQVDADGQHDLSPLKNFIQLSQENPSALLSGEPIYDKSMPLGRRIGRWFTHIWVWVETLSCRITDTMCGFRIYPINPTLKILEEEKIGLRMDFDIEIMVRLFWSSVPVIMSPVRVIYPEENHSNFNVFHDNWRITKMHTKLVFTLLFNLPTILKNRPVYKCPNKEKHWATMGERGSFLGILFFAKLRKILGRKTCLAIGFPVVLFFYLTGKTQRDASKKFLQHALQKNVSTLDVLRHFMSFFAMALDKLSAWTGQLTLSDIAPEGAQNFRSIMEKNSGGLVFVSHLGSMDLCRAVSKQGKKYRVHILLHSKNSERYNRMLKALNPLSNINIIEVTEIGPGTILFLKERLEQGDWAVIAADRVPIEQGQASRKNITYVPFFGEDAPFAQGPYILASLLECPVYLSFATYHAPLYHIHTEQFSPKIVLNRKTRQQDIKKYTLRFSQRLEEQAKKTPYQWFNFFDFWAKKH